MLTLFVVLLASVLDCLFVFRFVCACLLAGLFLFVIMRVCVCLLVCACWYMCLKIVFCLCVFVSSFVRVRVC